MSSCKHATEARVGPKLKDSAATIDNPINSRSGKMCSCGKMCKNNRGLKIHQEKTKCQTPENKLVAPPQKCFVSLQNVILSSCLTFDDSVYYRTSDNTFIPISNSEKPVAGNKCYVQTKDIILHPLTEYLSNDINQCGAASCHTCNIFINDQSFKSNLTGREYKTISYDRLSCGSTNVIYGIHCVHCGLVYVGETGRSLRSRMNGHRSAIEKRGQSLLHRHFHQPDHSVDDMRVQILEKVYHSSENPTLLTSLRRTRELFWIKELGTAKPYGFNDQIKGVGTLSSISCKKTNIYSLFNQQPRWKRSHGKRRYDKKAPQPDITMSTLVDLVDMIEKPEGVHKINSKLFSISFPQLRCLQELALESTTFDYSSAEYRVIAIILDIANFRLFRPVRSDVPAENPKHFMKIKFLNKAVNAIKLPALLRSTSVTNKIPVYFRDKEPPTVSYEYTSTVASKLFNISPALSNLNVSEYFSNPQTCQCKEYKFCYEPHGHVITGDLRVIENAKLRELVAEGPKYREPNRVNWKATETMFLESIDLYAKNWSKREQVELKYLSEWKDQLKELVADRISNLKGHFKYPKCKVLDQPDVKDTLHKLHANYVLVPADKAANNVIIVCKKYYIDTLVKELGINNVNINNPTYIPIDDPFETIMKSHNQFITSVGLEISEEDQNLPYLYWTPKLHKSPYKHRFIAGSSKCTTKDLSCLLTKVLRTIKDGLVRYCNTKTSRNGVNNMWILKNSTSLLSSLDQLDVRTATSVQTFDFSTLCTSIPHDLLKSRISNLVHNAFRKKDGSVRYTHIKVTRAEGHFTHDINGGGDNMYTADNICKMIEFLIDNIFVQFGGRLFRQVIGIPMGTNCAPLLADLFLYSYENEFLDNIIRSGHRRLARSFNLCYRYIDDLIVFNNKKFLDYLKEIYPSQLTVEKANKSDHLADYLDLTFIIDSGGKLSTRLYDKRDDFDFHIVNFPYLSSNIPSAPSYGVYISQLIRYARCCSHYDDFRYHHKCLVDRLLSQGLRSLSRNSMADIRISLRNTRGQST